MKQLTELVLPLVKGWWQRWRYIVKWFSVLAVGVAVVLVLQLANSDTRLIGADTRLTILILIVLSGLIFAVAIKSLDGSPIRFEDGTEFFLFFWVAAAVGSVIVLAGVVLSLVFGYALGIN
jgi:hypothetical protein